jgi:hypothetical protein
MTTTGRNGVNVHLTGVAGALLGGSGNSHVAHRGRDLRRAVGVLIGNWLAIDYF